MGKNKADELYQGTKRTEGTTNEATCEEEFREIDPSGNSGNLLQPVKLIKSDLVHLRSSDINQPEFSTHDDWFYLDGRKLRPGLYFYNLTNPREGTKPEAKDEWICSPIHAEAITANQHGESFGLLLKFLNPNGEWHEWAAPMHLLKGSAEELRGELLNMGVRIDPKKRSLLTQWMMDQYPEKRITAALNTGWHDQSFVLPQKTIGDKNIRFQSEHAAHNDFVTAGSLSDWRTTVSRWCTGNPLLVLSASSAFAGPLLKRAKLQETGGAGIHFVGDSSLGKTTALQVAGSIWGSPGFVRTWRATSNGLEATAAALNDTILILDEISECDPREIGSIVYAMANGAGKQRASRTGGVRNIARWRIIALSSGERSLATHMAEAGKRAKAGQEARLLDLPATDRLHGLFDELHGHTDGRAFADNLKQSIGKNYGHAGLAFVEALINESRDLPELYSKFCVIPEFKGSDGVENRAADIFALIGMAGELATEYEITGWHEGEAIKAAMLGFELWREYRGQGQTETRQILKAISDFIQQNGDARFSSLIDKITVHKRAGYWKDTSKGRIFYFNSPAIKEAASGFEIRRILNALESAGWIIEHDKEKRSKKVKIDGSAVNLYAIRPDNLS